MSANTVIELTNVSKVVDGVTVYQIRAKERFDCKDDYIEKGELGGYVDSLDCFEDNESWVSVDSVIIKSHIANSSIEYSSIENSTIIDANVSNSTIRCSNIEKGDIRSSRVTHTRVRWTEAKNSTIFQSLLYDTGTENSEIRNSIITVDTVINNSVIRNSTIHKSFIDDATLIDATVESDNDYLVLKNNWSSKRHFTWTKSNNLWKVGCFHGTAEELIKKAYKDSEYKGKCYELAVKYAMELQKIREEYQ